MYVQVATMQLVLAFTAAGSPFCAEWYRCGRRGPLWRGEWARVLGGVARSSLHMTEIGGATLKLVTPGGVATVSAAAYNALWTEAGRAAYAARLNPGSLHTFSRAGCMHLGDAVAMTGAEEASWRGVRRGLGNM